MVELRLNVSDVDYEALIRALAGQIAGPALMAARAMPDSAKEEMVTGYINANAARIERAIEGALASKGLHMKITGAQAKLIARPGTGA